MPLDADWPATAWALTAPESYVLLHGPEASGRETFKLALLELVARGTLRLVEVGGAGGFGRGRRVSVLAPGVRPEPPAAQALASLWLLYSGVPLRLFDGDVAGVALPDFVRAVRRRYRSLDRYRFEEVVAPLVDRGLLAREEYRLLWLWPARRVVVTPAGARPRADLERRLALGRAHFGGWVDADPARAVAFAGLAGAAVLLMNPLYGDIQRLRQQYGPGPTLSDTAAASGVPFVAPVDDDRPTAPDEPADDMGSGGLVNHLDMGGLDLGALGFDLDLSAFDSLDSVFSAIDAGVDGGAGDGGGGGGGGGGSDGGGGAGGGDGGSS